VIAHFDGVFHNNFRPDKKQRVQLQLKIEVHEKRTILAKYKWNETYATAKDTYINYKYDGNWQG
jgi:hypothetical protein